MPSAENPRINGYVLAGDPAWIEASVLSYYSMIDRLVVSFDETNTSWSGQRRLMVPECLARLDAIDTDGKIVLAPGRWDAGSEHPMSAETRQRQAALDLASRSADWVLQLDSDEILLDPRRFLASIVAADRVGDAGVRYPQRWVYTRAGRNLFLARSTRWWGARATYEAAQAVRAGTQLRWARMSDGAHFELSFGSSHEARADPSVIRPAQAIAHMAWVRSEEVMRQKRAWSGHAKDPGYEWDRDIPKWIARTRHPLRTAALTPVRRSGSAMLSLVRIPFSDQAQRAPY